MKIFINYIISFGLLFTLPTSAMSATADVHLSHKEYSNINKIIKSMLQFDPRHQGDNVSEEGDRIYI